ncbi:EF-hand domain-containing protein [Lysobacter soli]|uniref:HvfA family oxazolone/thioamide-modified RiPP metallophore n=1 Tax=Lysobacter soli TaxID=453783 RepID=UPI0037C9E848
MALSGSAFAVQPLAQGYMLGAAHAAAEGKCGEGKCGGTEASAKAQAKTTEGKCGEGQCGDAIFNSVDTSDDGRVSRAEFLKVEPKGAAVFAKKDTNKDGYIDEMESYLSVKAVYNENGREVPAGLFSTKK